MSEEITPTTGKRAITMVIGQKYVWCAWDITKKALRLEGRKQERVSRRCP